MNVESRYERWKQAGSLEPELRALLGLALDHLDVALAPVALAQLHRVVAAVLACILGRRTCDANRNSNRE